MLFVPQSRICVYVYILPLFILCPLLNCGSIYKGSFLFMGCDIPQGAVEELLESLGPLVDSYAASGSGDPWLG